MNNNRILIIGSSGMVGQELSRLLKNQGETLRLATSQMAQTKEQVHVNLVSGEGIKEAFEGVDRAFLLAPPGYSNQHALLSPLIQEAKRRGLKKVVLMTAMGANADESTPFRRAEVELEKSGLAYNIIRPNWFLQNFHTFWIHGIATQNKILLPAGQAKVSFIDARDIALVAAKLLTSSQFDNHAFDLTGPESIDHAQVAKAISQVSGREIKYQEITEQEFLNGLLGAGLPKDYAQFLTMIMSFLKLGYSERRTANVKEITGHEPRGINTYVKDYKIKFMNK